jgi:GMP synthase-like glutamine amidotransferase
MKIGILETGLLREQLTDRFDPYPIMFDHFLNLAGGALEIEGFSVIRGEMPTSITECDGWLITGSRHGVYENLDWMIELQSFIRDIAANDIPLVGICFGHQIIAQALGGEVVKSDKGWALGLHHYEIEKNHSWMESGPGTVGLYAFHQDQVVKIPKNAEVFASSDFCPYAGLSYGDSIISLQAHPEFEEAYETTLLDLFNGNLFSTELADEAYASMSEGRKADQERVSSWLSNFFLMSKPASAVSNS